MAEDPKTVSGAPTEMVLPDAVTNPEPAEGDPADDAPAEGAEDDAPAEEDAPNDPPVVNSAPAPVVPATPPKEPNTKIYVDAASVNISHKIGPQTSIEAGVGLGGTQAVVRRDGVNVGGLTGSVAVGLQTSAQDYHPSTSTILTNRVGDPIRGSFTDSRPAVSYQGAKITENGALLTINADVGTNGAHIGTEYGVSSSVVSGPDNHQVGTARLTLGGDVVANKQGAGAAAYAGVFYTGGRVTASVEAQVEVGAKSFGSRHDVVAAVAGQVDYKIGDKDSKLSGYFRGAVSTDGRYAEVGVKRDEVFTLSGIPFGVTAGVGINSQDVGGRDGAGYNANIGGGAYVRGGLTVKM